MAEAPPVSANSPRPARVRPLSDRFRLRWDIGQFVLFLLATMPNATGIPAHEWIGAALIPILTIHLAANWEWIVRTSRGLFRRLPGEVRFNHVWNALLFVVMTLALFSGLIMSRTVVRVLRLPMRPDAFWAGMHESSATLAMVMIGVHLAMHARWVIDHCRRRPAAVPLGREPS